MSLNVELRYGTKRHNTVRDGIMARVRIADTHLQTRIDDYNKADEQYHAFLRTEDAETAKASSGDCHAGAADSSEDSDAQAYTTLYIPYSYATLLAAHTYWTSVFLSRAPVLQFQGRHGEAEHSIQALEAVIDYQVQVGAMVAAFYSWLHDTPKYGVGFVWNYWDVEQVRISRVVEEPVTLFGIDTGKTKKVKETADVTGYEGNRVFNVRPHNALLDPRVSVADLQKGEFVGRYTDTSFNNLARGKASGRYFNIDVVRRVLKGTAKRGESDEGSEFIDLPEEESIPTVPELTDVGFAPLIEIVIELVPKDWMLGSGDMPEKWIFTLVDEEVIIEARPYGAFHNKYPMSALSYEYDAYTTNPNNMLGVMAPLGDTLNWLVNTHFYNVRSALNNQFVYDPMRIVSKDLRRKGAGKLIRLKEEAYGTDVRSVIQQLPVADVTQGHLRDSNLVTEMLQRVSGVTDNVMGAVNPGGRKTATEIRSSNTFGINRLKTMAEFWSEMGFKPMSQMLVQNTQQYMSEERMFRVTGDLNGPGVQETLKVAPTDILGFFDFVPVDGALPVDRYAQANLWREILMGLVKVPQLGQQYNIGGIFEWMAQLAGLKNIKRFRVQMTPDMQLQKLLQAGNVVPAGGQGGGPSTGARPSASAGRDEGRLAGVPEPGQLPGMGQTG